MNTVKLWRKLINPPLRHPIVRYNMQKSGISLTPHWLKWVVLLGAIYVFLRFNIPGLVLSGLALGLLLPALFIITSGTLLGLRTAVDTSNRIVLMQENGTGELFTLSSQGTLGWRWLVGVGCLHCQEHFREQHHGIKLLLGLGVLASLTTILLMGRDVLFLRGDGLFLLYDIRAFLILLAALPLIAGLYVDHIQSIVLGVLMGIHVPTIAQSRIEAHSLAIILFLLLQVVTYACVGLIYAFMIPTVYGALHIEGAFAEFIRVVLTVLLLAGLREGLIRILWWAARHTAEQPYSIDMLPGVMVHTN